MPKKIRTSLRTLEALKFLKIKILVKFFFIVQKFYVVCIKMYLWVFIFCTYNIYFIANYYIFVFLWFLHNFYNLYINIIKNPLRTFLGLNSDKKKNIKAWRKKGSSYKKKSVGGREGKSWRGYGKDYALKTTKPCVF